LSDFKEIYIVSTDCREILKYQFWWKSVLWERSYCMRTEIQADIRNIVDAFGRFMYFI